MGDATAAALAGAARRIRAQPGTPGGKGAGDADTEGGGRGVLAGLQSLALRGAYRLNDGGVATLLAVAPGGWGGVGVSCFVGWLARWLVRRPGPLLPPVCAK